MTGWAGEEGGSRGVDFAEILKGEIKKKMHWEFIVTIVDR